MYTVHDARGGGGKSDRTYPSVRQHGSVRRLVLTMLARGIVSRRVQADDACLADGNHADANEAKERTPAPRATAPCGMSPPCKFGRTTY